jgi:hypothetical protein
MEIDLNKLMNYKSIAYASDMAQLGKVKEEYKELMDEVVEKYTFSYVKDRDKFIAEALDLITATVNLLLISGLTEQDFEKHIAKLESYKNRKYKRQEDELKGYTSRDLDEALAYCKEKIKELCGDCKMQHEKLCVMLEDLKKMRIGKEWN